MKDLTTDEIPLCETADRTGGDEGPDGDSDLTGTSGDDTEDGGDGDDRLAGGIGADDLSGGTDGDTLACGGGNDAAPGLTWLGTAPLNSTADTIHFVDQVAGGVLQVDHDGDGAADYSLTLTGVHGLILGSVI
jgi:Ca2+-binding RTX toxin-like protein